MVRAADVRRLGRTGLAVSAMSFGGSPIGNFGRELQDADSADLVAHAWSLGIRYFDTAPLYGFGLGEQRLGAALKGYPRDRYSLSSKVGRLLHVADPSRVETGPWIRPAPYTPIFDYSYDGVLRSVEESLVRIGTDRMDMLFIHDVDRRTHGSEQSDVFDLAVRDGFRALERMRDEKVVTAIGFGVNEADVCLDAIRSTDSDCVLLAGRYSLLEQQPLDELFPLCLARGVGVILGGVFNSGILATGSVREATFDYAIAPRGVLDRVRRIETVCDDFGVPLAAAALQFAAAHPVVASICVGVHSVDQQSRNAALLEMAIPADFWDLLRKKGLIRVEAPTG